MNSSDKHDARPNGQHLVMSLREFSRLAGVSASTVSRVFAGKNTVAAATRERILSLADQVGFKPSAIGQAAFGGKTRSVGVFLPHLGVSFFSDIAGGIQDRLLDDAYVPLALQRHTRNNDFNCCRALQQLIDHRVDGVIIMPVDEKQSIQDFMPLLRYQLPMVQLGIAGPVLECDRVHTNDEQGGRLVGEHLLDLGHERIGYTYYGEGMSTCEPRVKGLRGAMEQRGLILESRLQMDFPARAEDGCLMFRKNIHRVLASPSRPSAVFATTDLHAVEVLRAALELGLRVPGDLSLVGFADLNFASMMTPALTTVRQDGYAVGHRAADLLLRRMAEPEAPRVSPLIPVELVKRESTARV